MRSLVRPYPGRPPSAKATSPETIVRSPDSSLAGRCLRGKMKPGSRASSEYPTHQNRDCARREGFEPPTAKSVACCSTSIWSAPDGSSLLTLDALGPDGHRRIAWVIIGMMEGIRQTDRMARQESGPVIRLTSFLRVEVDPRAGLRSRRPAHRLQPMKSLPRGAASVVAWPVLNQKPSRGC